jgi:hypothetical protein
MAITDPIGGLYVCQQVNRIPNASAVHTVVKNEHGWLLTVVKNEHGWLLGGSILCLFKEPILIIDQWNKQLSYKQKMNFYIALYKDNIIAIPVKWIKDKEPIYTRVENGQL